MDRRTSVVIPCYRQARYLPDALASLAAQDQPPARVVVVDDGSPDDVETAVRPFPWVTVIRQENQGVAVARNRGLAECSEPFVIFLDADDRLLPNAVRAGSDALVSCPDCAFVWGFNRGVDADGRAHPRPPTDFRGEPSYAGLLERNIVGAPAGVAFRAEAVRRVGGFDSTVPAAEDYDLFVRLARTWSFACHGQLVAEYRHHGGNMSGDTSKMLVGVRFILDREERWLLQGGRPPGSPDPRASRQALARGRRAAQRLYDGEPRLEALRTAVRQGSWVRAVRLSSLLAFRYPSLLARALGAALQRRRAEG